MDQFLFVYGTLRSDVAHPMHLVVVEYAEPVGGAIYQGRLFDLGTYPAVTPDKSGDWHVIGELYRLLQPELLLDQLDRYEGCSKDDLAPCEYRREIQQVSKQDGTICNAWMYLYNLPLESPRWIPSGDYLNRQGSR